MKRFLPLLLVLLAFSSLFARTQPGKSSFAARVTEFGHEFGFGRMISPVAMVLLDADLEFISHSEESLVASTTLKGDVRSSFSLAAYPEYRMYILPRNRVVPYFGLYGLVGFGSTSAEEPEGNCVFAKNGRTLTLGAGATLGAEFFLNDFISLSVHTRFAQYSFTSSKMETDLCLSTVEDIDKTHRFSVQFEPALYVRIYF
ncbi:hypothetical protein JW998_07215 [candidate division KSB1 bacterium]|nr:hypothetical protein [candidate division KSB1 bacterium]